MKTILVTGGSGWLGSAVVRRLLERGDRVVSADIGINPGLAALARSNDGLINEVADLGEWSQVMRLFDKHPIDAVVHTAAIVGVLQCADIPAKALRVNVEGMVNLLEAMRFHGVKRVIHVSTEETYGDFLSESITEDHVQKPTSIYGLTKLAAEHYGDVYSRDHGLECIHVRTCWVYGPNLPRPRMPQTYVDAALRGERLHHRSGGDLAVDQVYIEDTVTGLLLALDKEEHRFRAYNVATGEAPTLSQVAALVAAEVPGADLQIDAGPYSHGDRIPTARKGALDISRARAELGYEPAFPIGKGIALMVRISREARGN
ncbi:NAD-dependent epimerase/dehydratase family protein [Nitratireductor indicus]|uniref:NAD-dependent epimerase/dehydratase n=1 Tax=Nitratireductor indicus C115 TaxID=1231190 RepID=K2NXL6_9HYPH|nr:NAD(P)-dependent oxidoreductase [Nitratireductor indicus]EKF39836.1 NAD-dependent epimerase/dehydratase [Nitratireductor indicus C115]MDS1136187.1 NAD(P)-dependent oxidoreductase [Nitratireductor indicus]SFQ82263.1 dTDP-glucose 4,6-dehydratase/UDP-glucose 4-epimerase/UDP-glucuronate 4-epimerase [Nitratireductor indicus]